MATLVTGSSAINRSPSWAAIGSSSVSFGGGYLFYSNSPETVYSSALADNGCWLNRASVTGEGQVYLWHNNSTGSQINSLLLIYNPNTYAIKVTSTNHGTSNIYNGNDSSAWVSYFITSSISTTINAGSWGSMFAQTIPASNNFGVVARTNVTNNSSGAAASAVFYDIAYISNSSGATTFAAPNTGQRGHSTGSKSGFYNTLSFNTITPTDSTNGIGYKIGASSDTFSGNDLVYLTDDSGQTTGDLDGSYGQQLVIILPIHNGTSSARSFRIFIGSTGGLSYPLVNLNGSSASYASTNPYYYRDVIDTGTIAIGDTTTVTFFLVVPAIASTPYVIGARPL